MMKEVTKLSEALWYFVGCITIKPLLKCDPTAGSLLKVEGEREEDRQTLRPSPSSAGYYSYSGSFQPEPVTKIMFGPPLAESIAALLTIL